MCRNHSNTCVSKPFRIKYFNPIRKIMLRKNSEEYVSKTVARSCFQAIRKQSILKPFGTIRFTTIRKNMSQNHSEEYISAPVERVCFETIQHNIQERCAQPRHRALLKRRSLFVSFSYKFRSNFIIPNAQKQAPKTKSDFRKYIKKSHKKKHK